MGFVQLPRADGKDLITLNTAAIDSIEPIATSYLKTYITTKRNHYRIDAECGAVVELVKKAHETGWASHLDKKPKRIATGIPSVRARSKRRKADGDADDDADAVGLAIALGTGG